ncbi:hypothetical protein JHK87_050256 [Glycine soja]|nr:hypothetical protein JHK87_050256 [Glycine soja]
MRNKIKNPNVMDYMAVASTTDGMVGAELANIIEVAAINMMRDSRTERNNSDSGIPTIRTMAYSREVNAKPKEAS